MPTLRVRDIPNSFESAKKLLGNSLCRKVSKNGWLAYDVDRYCINLKLWDTVIIKWYPGGYIELDTGGFNTRTTRYWMSIALPYPYAVYSNGDKSVLYKHGMYKTELPTAISIEKSS